MNSTVQIDVDTSYSNGGITTPPQASVPNGGYLAGLLLGTIEARLDEHLRPRSVAITYLSATQFAAPLTVVLSGHGRGKTSAFLRAEGRQGADLRLALEATYGVGAEGPVHQPALTASVPPPDDCPEAVLPEAMTPHFSRHCDYRLAEAPRPFSGAERAEMLCWIRLKRGGLDAASAIFITDAMFPAFYLAATEPFATRTSNLHVMFSGSFERLPEGSWILAHFSVRDWVGAWCIEEARMWTPQGKLLAVGQHLRRIFT